ncbi:ABC transporter ATP-binding protein/permease, partial [Candidatus Pelagibacter sp.]|nr:ABC transporter ATP-binding protein/permease [Candidatus Pelagibacter sp.]
AAFRLMPSMNRIILASQNLRYGHAATQRIYEELEILKNSVDVNIKNEIINEKFHTLKLKNISFSYNEKTHIFNNIDFEIKKGDFIGIIGETGSGKSTLIDLLTGLINPSSGKIICNDKYEITNCSVSWQSKIGYAPQMFNLLDDTIENNISFDNSSKKNEKVLQDSIKISVLEEFIEKNPNKLKSIVGERGIQISGGQRQRIIIARALYRKPEILILDEATNALDSSTEQKIITNLCEKKAADLTIIMVTHRESSLKKCNKILRVKNKTITIENN